MLESAIQTVGQRDDNATFSLLSMYPEEDALQNSYDNLEILNAKPLRLGVIINSLALMWRVLPFMRKLIERKSPEVRCIAEADILLDQGGITFVDGREKFLIYNVASILPALMMRTPVFKCAQALGPFEGKINRLVSKYFLPKVDTIISRGSITHEHLVDLGLSNVARGADYAFSLEMTSEEKVSAAEKVDMSFFEGGEVVGLSPSVVMRKKVDANGGDYVSVMSDFIDYLTQKRGLKVALLPHSVRLNTDKTHNNDLPLCREIYQQLGKTEKVLFVEDELSSQELRFVIGECDVFVASRFHAMVSALAMKVPVLVIGWSHKYQEVLAMFGLEKWAFGQDKLTSTYLKRRFADLLRQSGGVREQLESRLVEVKRKSEQQADEIVKVAKRQPK